MVKLSAQLLGEDYSELIKQTPQSKRKISILGSALMVPVIIWFFTSYLFVSEMYHFSILSSFLMAGGMAFLIFLIERSIILSSGSKLLTFFRVALGLIIALLGSICIDEVLFKDDIKAVKLSLAEESFLEEPSQLKDLRNDLASLNVQLQDKQKATQLEAQGKGSGSSGVGPITRLLNEQVEDIKNQILSVELKLQNQIKYRESQYFETIAKINGGNTDSELLENVKALVFLISKDNIVLFAFVCFFLFFFLLEFLVIILKTTLPKSAYERRIELIELIAINKAEKITQRLNNQFNPIVTDPRYTQVSHALDQLSNGVYSIN